MAFKVSFAALTLVAAVVGNTLPIATEQAHAQAQNCYLDDRGRIVTRRRPGYQRVDCPQVNKNPIDTGTTTPSTTTQGTTTQGTVTAPVSRAPVQPIQEGATSVFFSETKPGSAADSNPPQNSNSGDPVQSPSQSGLFQLPSRGNSATVTNSDGTIQTIEEIQAPPNPVSPIPRPTLADYKPSQPIPDRWKIVDSLGTLMTGKLDGFSGSLLNPYDRNKIKGDTPVGIGDDWFFNVIGISDTVVETRNLPTPVGSSSTNSAGGLDVFGDSSQLIFSQTFAAELVYYKGDTVFRPPDYEFRFTPAFNYNYLDVEEVQAVNADPARGTTRSDRHLGIQAAFFDKHLRDVSDRYDFDSFRIGIQPFSTDFRGFLFQDNQFGARLFGTRDNNIYQYNLAWFRRIEKDTNSGLNDIGKGLRNDDVFIANLYKQDYPVKGFISQASVVYNRNREDNEFYFDENDFIQRPASLGREVPRKYDVVYLGFNGDGHFDRINLTTSAYAALGSGTPGVFVDESVDISAFFGAAEVSLDYDWIRPRFSFLFASGDSDPLDDRATGFDAIFENPQFAGGDTVAIPATGTGSHSRW